MHPSDLGTGVVVLDGLDVRFEEIPGHVLSREVLSAVDRAWETAVRANPVLFDGPVVLCSDIRQTATRLTVSWSRATYRYRTARQIPDAPRLSSMFVCVVQPSTDGRLLVGRMSATTSNPGVVQFPGGNLEPTPVNEPLTLRTLHSHAAVELGEETGIEVAPGDLDLWAIVRTTDTNVGFFFLAPSLPADCILERHASLVTAERLTGTEPELTEVALIAHPDDLPLIHARPADYLEPLLARFRSTSP